MSVEFLFNFKYVRPCLFFLSPTYIFFHSKDLEFRRETCFHGHIHQLFPVSPFMNFSLHFFHFVFLHFTTTFAHETTEVILFWFSNESRWSLLLSLTNLLGLISDFTHGLVISARCHIFRVIWRFIVKESFVPNVLNDRIGCIFDAVGQNTILVEKECSVTYL